MRTVGLNGSRRTCRVRERSGLGLGTGHSQDSRGEGTRDQSEEGYEGQSRVYSGETPQEGTGVINFIEAKEGIED